MDDEGFQELITVIYWTPQIAAYTDAQAILRPSDQSMIEWSQEVLNPWPLEQHHQLSSNTNRGWALVEECHASNWDRSNQRHSGANQVLTPWQQRWTHRSYCSELPPTSGSHRNCSLTPGSRNKKPNECDVRSGDNIDIEKEKERLTGRMTAGR